MISLVPSAAVLRFCWKQVLRPVRVPVGTAPCFFSKLGAGWEMVPCLISSWMRKGAVAIEGDGIGFSTRLWLEREDKLTVNHPLLPESKQTSKQGADPSANPWEPAREPSAHSLMTSAEVTSQLPEEEGEHSSAGKHEASGLVPSTAQAGHGDACVSH